MEERKSPKTEAEEDFENIEKMEAKIDPAEVIGTPEEFIERFHDRSVIQPKPPKIDIKPKKYFLYKRPEPITSSFPYNPEKPAKFEQYLSQFKDLLYNLFFAMSFFCLLYLIC